MKKSDDADIIFLGVPDESGSYAERRGTDDAPDTIRKISIEREVFERGKYKTHALPQICPLNKNIFDSGNIKKKDVAEFVENVIKNEQIPVTVGGDHSITAEVLKGLDKSNQEISVVYFDAHPDFICSARKNIEPIVCDIGDYKNVSFSSSIEVGVRDPEPEELKSIRQQHLKVITPFEIAETGLLRTLNKIRRAVGRNIYISVDMDVLDPVFAPGVSCPVPCGINSNQLIYLMKMLAEIGIVGFDIMEVNPKYDIQDMTSHLAARIIRETIAGLRNEQKKMP